MVPVIVVIMLYTLIIGWCLLGRVIQPDTGFLLIALPCLIPAGWYAYGFLSNSEPDQDYGLLFSTIGWVLVALACFIRFLVKTSEVVPMQDGTFTVTTRSANSPAAMVCGVFAVICILLGILFSWLTWQKRIRSGYGMRG